MLWHSLNYCLIAFESFPQPGKPFEGYHKEYLNVFLMETA